MTSRIVVLIPCYQGGSSVGAVVRGARASGLRVAVVDDGSTDGSADQAAAAGAVVLRHAANQGKGAALATGFAWARTQDADAVLTMDADGQHDPAELPSLIGAFATNRGALVIGVRSFAPGDMPRRSRIGNRISTWWISRFSGRPHRDSQSGFRVYPRELYASVELATRRFETETELLLRAAKLGIPLVEVPIQTLYGPDRVTHFHGLRDTLLVLRLVLSSVFWRRATATTTSATAPR